MRRWLPFLFALLAVSAFAYAPAPKPFSPIFTLATSAGHILDGYTYQHDALGQRTNLVRNLGLTSSTVAAGFDDLGQLVKWTGREANGTARLQEQLAYGYDFAGNLAQRTNNALVQTK